MLLVLGPSLNPTPMTGSDWIWLGITFLLMLSVSCFLGALSSRMSKDKTEPPPWWMTDDEVPEPVWPGGGAIPPEPKKEEKELADLCLR